MLVQGFGYRALELSRRVGTVADSRGPFRSCICSRVWGSRSSGRSHNLQVVRVVHDAKDVPKGVDHRSGDEPRLAAVRKRLVFTCSHGQQPLDGSRHVVDVPVQDGAARACRRCFGLVAAVNQAQLVLVVADTKLVVPRAFELRFDAQQFGVPFLCGLKIVSPIADEGESSQHACSLRRREHLPPDLHTAPAAFGGLAMRIARGLAGARGRGCNGGCAPRGHGTGVVGCLLLLGPTYEDGSRP